MNCCQHLTAPASPLSGGWSQDPAGPRLRRPRGAALAALTRTLTGLVRAFAAWRALGRRAAQDRHVLDHMSDRELVDIGLARGSVRYAARGTWVRDYPY